MCECTMVQSECVSAGRTPEKSQIKEGFLEKQTSEILGRKEWKGWGRESSQGCGNSLC